MYERKSTKGADSVAEEIRETLRLFTMIVPDNATVDGEFLIRSHGYVYIVNVKYIPDLNPKR